MEASLTKKNMTKDEVALFVDLVQSHPLLTTKLTNAATNKQKEDTWTDVTNIYNARSGSIYRTKSQLKLKWDNLKKAARKRAQTIRMAHLKTGGGGTEDVPVDHVLEKVSSLMGSSCTGFEVPFGGDASSISETEPLVIDDDEVIVEVPPEEQTSNRIQLPDGHDYGQWPPRNYLPLKKAKNKDPTGRRARNLAIAEYYTAQTFKTELEIKKLQIELEKNQ